MFFVLNGLPFTVVESKVKKIKSLKRKVDNSSWGAGGKEANIARG